MRSSIAVVTAGALIAALLPDVPAQAASGRATASGRAAAGKPAYNPPVYRGKLWSPRKLETMPSVGGHTLAPSAGKRALAALKPPHEPGSVPAVPYRAPSRQWWPSGSGTARFSQAVPVRDGRITGEDVRELTGPQPAGTLPVTVTPLGTDGRAATPAAAAAPASAAAPAAASAAASAAAPAAVHVSLASRRVARADGVSGVVFKVSGSGWPGQAADQAPGQALVRLDYARFARNYGGAWASRLRLVELPACALTTPGLPGCSTPIWVPGSNDGTHSVWAKITLGQPSQTSPDSPDSQTGPVVQTSLTTPQFSSELTPRPRSVVLAAVSTPGGAAGNYAATSLTPEGTWSVQQGNFSYDYPIAVPPSLGGPAPTVALSYSSSAAIDGETSAQNPQGSQIGDGWSYSPGFIEQSYEPCNQDTSATTAEAGDDCWDGYNATISLGGRSGTLVGTGPGTWHMQSDDGTKIQLLTGGANGAWNNEYWLVTTTDGTKYYFGANHVPGSPTSSLTTSSAWSVPVYCPNSADPCNSSASGSSSWTQMPWRWNLDYVVDPAGNLTVYQYAAESNNYLRGGSTGSGTLTSYTRAGYPTAILYGWHLADATASPAVLPADKVVFGPSARCLSGCSTVTATAFPDVPTDQICATGSTTCHNASPTFFSEKRLTSITTDVLQSQSSGTYSPVDTYALAQQFDTGTGEATAVMALTGITRTTGETGTTPILPSTQFDVTMMNNRVAGTTQPALYRPRISEIQTEAGATISVDYNPPQCTQGTGGNITNADAPTNTLACYPGFWAPPNQPNSMDWFDYYTVSQVEVADGSGANSVPHDTDYTYPSSGVAWHYDENLTEASKYRTWDEYRGYLSVKTTTGQAPDPITQTVTYYLRGMDGDNNGSGSTKSVSVSDTIGDSYTDSNNLSGQVLETDTFSQAGGSPDSETFNGPWSFATTASMTPPSGSGLSTISSFMPTQARARTRRLLASGSWQTSTTTSYFNGNAQIAAVDKAPAGLPETCTSTSYASAPSANPMMESYPDRVTIVSGGYDSTAGACPAVTSGDLLSDTESYYDDETATISSLGTLGSLTSPGGLPTGLRKASGWNSGTETWQAQSATQYDGYGRVTASYDADGNKSTVSYTPATQALPTSTTKKNPLGWTTTTALNQDRQLPVSVTDPNGEVTTEAYDALGRLTSVTLPLDQGGNATYKYSYTMTGTSPPAITTQTLRDDGSYATDVKIYDGMLQLIEDQTSTANNAAGRLVTYTTYNSDGWQATTTPKAFYDSSASPSTALFAPDPSQIPAQTVSSYDGQGRITASALYSLGVSQWQTTTSYPGLDQAHEVPPAGGTATTVVTNSLGQTAKSMQYTDSSGDADTTSYTFSALGQVTSVSDNNSNTWTYTYNLLGQEATVTDPGTTAGTGSAQPGTTQYQYDPVGNMTQSTDANGTVLTFKYDTLGRRISEFNATPGVPNEPVPLDSWAYDKSPLSGSASGADALGYPTSGTSYDSTGAAYTETVTGYNTAYEATGSSMSVPSSQGALATGTTANEYTTTTAYTPRTGLAEYTTYSNDGGLPTETIYNTYDEQGLLTQFGNSANYLDNVSYDPLGQVLSTTFGNFGSQLVQDYTYDAGTARMLGSITNLQTASTAADTTSYTYDQAGNVTSVSNAQNTGGTQTQCFSYNALDQLTTAWTDTGGTTTAAAPSVSGIGGCDNSSPAAADIGGPAPYWQSYTYDLLGDRTSETSYNTSLPASQDTQANATTQEVQYPGGNLTSSPSSNAPATAQAQPDTAASIVTASPAGSTTMTPSYNAAGQLTAQSVTKTTGQASPATPPSLSKITYTPQGQIASVTTATGATSYTYDSSGNMLVQASPTSTTLYADAGAEEITLTGSTVTGLRLLAAPDGVTVAESSSGTVSYEIANQQKTATEVVTAGSLAVTRRYFDPWGQPVGTPPAWPDNNTFLGKPQDPNSGLVVLGARAYDPATGSFTSLDPVLEAGSPQQMGGYSYSADNPVTNSDPSGKCDQWCQDITQWYTFQEAASGGKSENPPSGGGKSENPIGGGGDPGGGCGFCGFGWGFWNGATNLKAEIRKMDLSKEIPTIWGTVTIKIEVTLEGGSGDSIVSLTLGKDLDGDADIELPNGGSLSVPVNLLVTSKEVAEDGMVSWKGASYTAVKKDGTFGGVPYTVSESFGPLSVEFDLSAERSIEYDEAELGSVSIKASITFERNPNVRTPPPPGGPLGQLNTAEDRPTDYIPTRSQLGYDPGGVCAACGAAGAAAILAALFGAAYRSLFGSGSSKPPSPSLGLTPAFSGAFAP